MKKELLVALMGELYFVKFNINPEEDDVEPEVVFGRSFLRLTKGIVDFGNGIITIYPNIITFNDDNDDELDNLLANIDVIDLPPLDITDIPPFMCSIGKSGRNKKQPLKNYKMSYDVKRLVIETLKYSDKHKKVLDSVLLDKLKLDEDLELEEEEANKEMVKNYKAIKDKNDLGVFVLPIRLEAKFDLHALADTGLNINVIPYRIYVKLRREQVKPVSQRITMFDHSKVESMGILKDVLCQVGVTKILAKIFILDILVDRDVPIVFGRSFLYTCGSILNTIKGSTSTFDGVCHQKFHVVEVRNNHGESDSDDEEEYCLKRDEMGKPFYGPNHASYLSCDDLMD
ncbi:DNA-directed DNA polymerase [Tanacetum coccineum]